MVESVSGKQNVVMSIVESPCSLVSSCVSQGSVLDRTVALCVIFLSDLQPDEVPTYDG